jgi:ABC-type branched-subunit amino acid transport system substrate-binding protein
MKLSRAAIGAVATIMIASLSACGNDDGGSDASGPIKIYQQAPYESQAASFPFIKSSAQAAVDEINAAGGVKGRDLELITCNNKVDPNEALRCAQKAAQEKSVADVGSVYSAFGAQILPVLEKSGIASIGNWAISPADAQSDDAFLLDIGIPAFTAMPQLAKDQFGATKVATLHLENPSAETSEQYMELGSKSAGLDLVEKIVVPATAIDYTQYVARAEDAGATVLLSSMTAEPTLKVWKALQASGSDMKLISSAGSMTPDILKEAGAVADGDIGVNGTPAPDDTNEWGKQYVAAMKKYQPDEKAMTSGGMRSYYAVHLFADVAETIEGGIDADSVLKAFNAVHDKKFAWIDSLSFDQKGPIDDLPRIVSSVVFPVKVQGGALVAQEPFDPFK